MTSATEQNFLDSIQSLPFNLNQPLILAVSGGLDSMVLWDLCQQYYPRLPWHIAHFNHRQRGKESEQDAQFVSDHALKQGRPFSTATYAGSQNSSEEALRDARLAFLKELSTQVSAQFILTAHHLDDQLETFLMRWMRGSHWMRWVSMRVNDGLFARPLLNCSRNDLEVYADARSVTFRKDLSNESESFLRNRVRSRLVPVLKELALDFGDSSLFMERFRFVQADLLHFRTLQKNHADSVHAGIVQTPFFNRLPQSRIVQLSPESRSELLQSVFFSYGKRIPNRSAMELLQRAVVTNGAQIQNVSGIHVQSSYDQVFFSSPEQRSMIRTPIVVKKAGDAFESAALNLQFVPKTSSSMDNQDFRTARYGDRWGKSPLFRKFQKHRIPLPERHLIPVVTPRNSTQVTWALGLSQDNPYGDLKLGFPFSFFSASLGR